jgi:hypothetical protein
MNQKVEGTRNVQQKDRAILIFVTGADQKLSLWHW